MYLFKWLYFDPVYLPFHHVVNCTLYFAINRLTKVMVTSLTFPQIQADKFRVLSSEREMKQVF